MEKSHVLRHIFWMAVVLVLFLCSSVSALQPDAMNPSPQGAALVPGYGYGLGYYAVPYGYTYNPRRAYRQSLRYGYPPIPPAIAVPMYGYPYYGYAPYGYVPLPLAPYRGPRDFLHQPGYEQPPRQYVPAPVPTVPAPMPAFPRAQPQPRPAPPPSGPEVIPAPPSDPSPQK